MLKNHFACYDSISGCFFVYVAVEEVITELHEYLQQKIDNHLAEQHELELLDEG